MCILTDEMVRAGADALSTILCSLDVDGKWCDYDVIPDVFRAMVAVAPPLACECLQQPPEVQQPHRISETEFSHAIRLRLIGVKARAVVGPGRSGAVASAYASHILRIPFLPYGTECPEHLRPLLIVDTARKSGATLRKAERRYGGDCILVHVFDEPPRLRFWYEPEAHRQG